MRRFILRTTLAVALLGLASPLAAADAYGIKIFGTAVGSLPMDDSRARLAGQVATIGLGSDFGWEAGLEWRISPMLGLEASLARVTHDVDFGGQPLGRAELQPLFVSVNFHWLERDAWDWWIAPTLALYEWRSAGFRRGVEVDDGRDETFGATLGVDYAFGERWAFTAALRYFDSQIRFGGGGEAAVDPLMLRAGIAARF